MNKLFRNFLNEYASASWASIGLGVIFSILYFGKSSKKSYLVLAIGFVIVGIAQLILKKVLNKK